MIYPTRQIRIVQPLTIRSIFSNFKLELYSLDYPGVQMISSEVQIKISTEAQGPCVL